MTRLRVLCVHCQNVRICEPDLAFRFPIIVHNRSAKRKWLLIPLPKLVLGVAVAYKQFDILLHPTFRKLQSAMWRRFARFWAYIFLGENFLYILLWTLIGILVDSEERHKYSFPDDIWRIVLWLVAVAYTIWLITEEIREFWRSKNSHRKWEKWRQDSIGQDMKYCHPRFPEEKEYLKSELKNLDERSPKYFSDAWNIFDWLCFLMILVGIITHLVDVGFHTPALAKAHIRLMAVTVVLLWLRIMKSARAFALLGPFIVMLGHMLKDCARFLFLYLMFYIPFMCVFWMLFGGKKLRGRTVDGETAEAVSGYEFPLQLIFSLFRLTLVDDYDYDGMKEVDEVFADIVLIAWFLLSSILCLNLFIALLSDTFQRVYDNAQANSVMQKAITILNIWEGMSKARRNKFWDFIQDECSPLTQYYDDDLTQTEEDDLKKVTFQVKDQVEEFIELFKHHFPDNPSSDMILGLDEKNRRPGDKGGGDGGGGSMKFGGGSFGGGGVRRPTLVTADKFHSEVTLMQDSLKELQEKQKNFIRTYRQDMDNVQKLLFTLLEGSSGAPGVTRSPFEMPQADGSFDTPVAKLKKKKKKKKEKKSPPTDMVVSVEMLDPSADTFA